jgi:uncharacterized phosphosugar-binding protein
MSPTMSGYFAAVHHLLEALENEQAPAIDAAAAAIARSIEGGGVLHVFGSGHSMLAAIEASVRAGGLAAVNLLYDAALSPVQPAHVSTIEREHGYAETILDRADVRRNEVVAVVSNSGINAVPIELTLGAQQRGLTVVAVTSMPHSSRVSSRHESGRRLFEVADIVIDTKTPYGDTTVEAGGYATGAVSTILASAAVHAVTITVMELLAEAGLDVPVLISQNVDDSDDHNERLLQRYRDRTSDT